MSRYIKTMDQLKDSRLLYDKNPPQFGYMLILSVVFSTSSCHDMEF